MLDGKIALISGAGSGIGAATALRFHAEGATVVLAARRVALLEEVAGELGDRSAVLHLDVTDPDSCQAAVDGVVERFGRLDVLFNNAGIIYREKTAPATTVEEWDATFAVNTRGTFLMSRAAVPAMVAGGGGSIVNNASYFGLVGGQGAAAYTASKAAVIGLTKSMALDHAREGVRVNCVCAGSVDTPMLEGEIADIAAIEGRSVEDVGRRFAEKHPLGRISTPDEIAAAVTFLASGEAGFVTGVALPVDGGLTAG